MWKKLIKVKVIKARKLDEIVKSIVKQLEAAAKGKKENTQYNCECV